MAKKIIYIFVITIATLCIIINTNYVYAANSIDDVMSGADNFMNAGSNTSIGNGIDESKLKSTSDLIYNMLLAIAIIAAVAIGIVIGIQFMTSGVEEQAKIKERLLPYVISCIVIFGAFGIWKLAVTVMSSWTS